MLNQTKAIILRTVKYGETSLVVTAFTRVYGVQTYIVNGVRTAKKTGAKAAMFQPAAILDMQVYHSDRNSMHRIREQSWSYIYEQVLTDVVKNGIAQFMMELLTKLLKQPEANPELFDFSEDALIALDRAPRHSTGNFPLFLILHLGHFFGLRIHDNYSSANAVLDLSEGSFTPLRPSHQFILEGDDAAAAAELLKIMQPEELKDIALSRTQRQILLEKFIQFYALQQHDLGTMRTVRVLSEIFD